MNLQQLEYILAVDELRHFAKAAEYCNVTQPTLSAMIQKLEDELNTKLFDRTTQPVQPTLTGRKVIEQARITLRQANLIKDIVKEEAPRACPAKANKKTNINSIEKYFFT